MKDLSLHELSRANEARQNTWPNGAKIDLAFVAVEIGEEAGEVLGAVKKLIRHREKIAGNRGQTEEELLQRFADEAADLFINLSRMCNALGIDPAHAVRTKFNQKSEDVGLDVWL